MPAAMPVGILQKLRHPVMTYRALPKWARRLYLGANLAVLGKSVYGLGRGVQKAWNIPTDLLKDVFALSPEQLEAMPEARRKLVEDILGGFRSEVFGQAVSPGKAQIDRLHSEMVRRNLMPTIAREWMAGREHPVEIGFDVLRALTPVGWASLAGKHGVAPLLRSEKIERPGMRQLLRSVPGVTAELTGISPSELGPYYRRMAKAMVPTYVGRYIDKRLRQMKPAKEPTDTVTMRFQRRPERVKPGA